jgi:molecular chaperone GrpE
MNENHTQPPHSDEDLPVNEPTVDLNLDEIEGVDDLQALALEAAKSLGEPAAGTPEEASPKELLKRIKELEKEQVEQADKHQRLLADFANHRNRSSRDIQMAISLAERKLLQEFLPVIDSFERCMGSTYSNLEDLHNGVALIYKQLMEAMKKSGVEGVDLKVGDPFDAMHAEALTTIQRADLPDGAVAAIYERGFMHRDQLLRAARVIVNHNEAEGSSPLNPS